MHDELGGSIFLTSNSQDRTRIERSVLQSFNDLHRFIGGLCASCDPPDWRGRQVLLRRRLRRRDHARTVDPRSDRPARATHFGDVVEQCRGLIVLMRSTPVPLCKTVFKRNVTVIPIKISATLPVQRWVLHAHFDPCRWCNGGPSVQPLCVEGPTRFGDYVWKQVYGSAHAQGQGGGQFVDLDFQPASGPFDRTWANLQACGISCHLIAASFGHGPACGSRPSSICVEGNIEGAEMQRIVDPARARREVIR